MTTVVGLALVSFGLALRHDPVDAPIVRLLNDTHVGSWGLIADFVYTALEPGVAIAMTVLITGAVAVVSRSARIAVAFAGTVALTWLPIAAIKILVARPRPDVTELAHAFTTAQVDGSFPSGHTTFVAALAITVWFLLRRTRWSYLVVILGALATTTVSVAVVSDGLHYPTDVAASILWALGMAPTARWAMTRALTTRWFKGKNERLSS